MCVCVYGSVRFSCGQKVWFGGEWRSPAQHRHGQCRAAQAPLRLCGADTGTGTVHSDGRWLIRRDSTTHMDSAKGK